MLVSDTTLLSTSRSCYPYQSYATRSSSRSRYQLISPNQRPISPNTIHPPRSATTTIDRPTSSLRQITPTSHVWRKGKSISLDLQIFCLFACLRKGKGISLWIFYHDPSTINGQSFRAKSISPPDANLPLLLFFLFNLLTFMLSLSLLLKPRFLLQNHLSLAPRGRGISQK